MHYFNKISDIIRKRVTLTFESRASFTVSKLLHGCQHSITCAFVCISYIIHLLLRQCRFTGAPLDLTPTKDDPALGADPSRNNDFRYNFPDDAQTQDRCPFAAHTRKTNPRADLEVDLGASTEARRIIRRGIQFGPEVTQQEAKTGKTMHGRGLLFAAYQSNIVNGFQFIQHCKSLAL